MALQCTAKFGDQSPKCEGTRIEAQQARRVLSTGLGSILLALLDLGEKAILASYRNTMCTHLHTTSNKLCGRPPQYAPAPYKLTFDLLTLKVVSQSHVTWATFVPILVFLGLSVLDLSPMYATDRRQTRIIVECLRPMERGIKPWAGSILNMEQRRH